MVAGRAVTRFTTHANAVTVTRALVAYSSVPSSGRPSPRTGRISILLSCRNTPPTLDGHINYNIFIRTIEHACVFTERARFEDTQ